MLAWCSTGGVKTVVTDRADDLDNTNWGEPPLLPSPWPGLDPLLHLHAKHLIGIGVHPHSAEANLGYDLALHAAAAGIHTYLFAPGRDTPPATPNLLARCANVLTLDTIEQNLASLEDTKRATQLVVIDHFLHIRDENEQPLHDAEQAVDVGRRLKRRAAGAGVAQPAIVVMAHYTTAPAADTPWNIDCLGLAAELVYDIDTLLLLHRIDSETVDVHVAKDRHGPDGTTIINWPAPPQPAS